MRGKEYKKILLVLAAVTVTMSLGGTYKASAIDINEESQIQMVKEAQIPSKYVDEAKYTSIKNQEIDGVCWSFAGMATLESYLLKNNMGTYDFSEEYIKWMASEGLTSNYGWKITRGDGAPTQVVPGLLVSGKGPVLEESIKYDANNENSKPADLESLKPVIDVSEIEYIENNSKDVKNAIMNYGAVETCYYHDAKFAANNSTSYYCNEKTGTNHAVTIIGWDDNYSKDNFKEDCRPENNGAWLVKNSSGTEIGDNGLCWISYEDKNVLNTDYGNLNYAIKKAQKHNDNRNIYQYDEFGTVGDCTIAKANGFTNIIYANVYDFNKEDKLLDSVIFQNNNIGNKYIVYYMPVNSNGDIQVNKKQKLAEGTTEFKGYISVPVSNFELPEGKGAIAIEVSGENSNIGIGVETKVKVEGKEAFSPSYEKGQSYVIVDEDQFDINDESLNQQGNLSIKAVTLKEANKPEDDEKPGDTEKPSDEQKPGDNEKPGTSTNTPGDTEKPGDEQKPGDDQKPQGGSSNSGDMRSIPVFGLLLGALGSVSMLIKKKFN